MSSLNRAVKNCLPTIPEEYKAQAGFTPYARLWSVKLWPSRASYTAIKAISLRPALSVKAEGPDPLQHKQCINKATAIFLPHMAGAWRNSYHMYTGRRYRKTDWATTSWRSAFNMLTGTPCYSKGPGNKTKCSRFYDEGAETLGWEMRSRASWVTHSGAHGSLRERRTKWGWGARLYYPALEATARSATVQFQRAREFANRDAKTAASTSLGVQAPLKKGEFPLHLCVALLWLSRK